MKRILNSVSQNSNTDFTIRFGEKQKKNKNGCHVPFHASARRISQSVSVKNKKKNKNGCHVLFQASAKRISKVVSVKN